MIVVSLRSMPSRATGAPPKSNELLNAVYGSSSGESNGATKGILRIGLECRVTAAFWTQRQAVLKVAV